MILDFADIGAADDRRYDVAVLGSGPAGMSLALSLAESGKRVLVLEGGAFDYDPEIQAMYEGEVVGDPYFALDVTRLRQVGGSSNHWGGFCRELEPHVFGRRLDSDLLRWPIAHADLAPYRERTREILDIAPPEDDFVFDAESGVKRIFWSFSPPTRFRYKYEELLANSDALDICTRANFAGFETEEDRVTGLTVRDLDDNRATVRADAYVLAAGGLENSRILMMEERRHEGGFVDPRAPLGRYWMEHPHFWVGTVVIPDDFPDNSIFSLTAAEQARRGVLDCALSIGRMKEVERSWYKETAASIACFAPELGRRFYAAFERKLICGASLRAAWEQEPVYDNRVALSESATDRFGDPRIELHWTKTDLDRRTVLETTKAFGAYLAESDIGRLQMSPWLADGEAYPDDDELAGHHHMGGTRMAANPSEGVVDADCRVHGRRNLYVAGSSVYPAAGKENPTFTIVQLALRLADHLKTA